MQAIAGKQSNFAIKAKKLYQLIKLSVSARDPD